MDAEIKISSHEDLEKLITMIGIQNLEIKGKGFVNKDDGVVGFTIFPDNKPENMIDIFITSKKALTEK